MFKIVLISLAALLALWIIFALNSSRYFKNFNTKLYYTLLSFSGTREKMDALNKESIDLAKKSQTSVTILIHGAGAVYYKDVYGTSRWFKESGLNVVSFEYDYKAPPEESAEKLSVYVDKVLMETRTEKVNIIGICLGGVTARYYVEKLNGASRLDKLITIISPAVPIPSTELAYKYNKNFSFDPEPWNGVLEYIQDKNSVKKHLYISCKKDLLVPFAYQISRQGNFRELACGHSFINVNPDILQAALDFIQKE